MFGLKTPRGMQDLLPDQLRAHRYIERQAAAVLDSCGYRELSLPLVEQEQLYIKSAGDSSDLVTKEMYYLSRAGQQSAAAVETTATDSLCLRPEGTAGCVRAVIQHSLPVSGGLRLWYRGPMFRYERPQLGRRRQFQQLGAEIFGCPGPEADAELIAICYRLFDNLGLGSGLSLQLNHLGSPASRSRYREELAAWLHGHSDKLDPDSRRRLEVNPLRILDSKNPKTRELLNGAPLLSDFLSASETDDFQSLCGMLSKLDIPWQHNQHLVRGLDYYTGPVFEWLAEDGLGAQNAVAAGGRYDGLSRMLGGPELPASGFALGVERLLMLLSVAGNSVPDDWLGDAWMIAVGAVEPALCRAEQLRREVPGLRLLGPVAGSVKSQLRKADKSGVPVALFYGEQEQQDESISLLYLRDSDRVQHSMPVLEIIETLAARIKPRIDSNHDILKND